MTVSMTDVEAKLTTQRQVEDLIAISLYQAKINKVRDYLRRLYRDYEPYLKPIEEVREILAREIPEKETLSQEVVRLRRGETH